MTLRRVDALICPLCASSFERHDRTLRCEQGHSFDIAREGYVNLAPTRATKKRASDTKEMVDARLRFLERGLYRPLTDRIAEKVFPALEALGEGARTVIDVGCGPGFYLLSLFAKDRIWAGEIIEGAAGIDLSKAAVRRAAKGGGLWAVADVEEGIPVASGTFGVALSVFAPRPVGELRRIIRDDGTLVVAAAGPQHLHELRAELGLMKVRDDKQQQLAAQLGEAFEVEPFDRLTYVMDLDEAAARDLVTMGPNFWHRTSSSPDPQAKQVTADFLLTVARPKT